VGDGVVLHPSVSAGVAVFPRHGRSMEALMRHADQAMYDAKAARASKAGTKGQQSRHVTGG
jgi:GGDEF domain-containing protein